MANAYFKRGALNIYFKTGLDADGKFIKKRQTLQNVSQNATPASLLAVANAINALYDGELIEIEAVNNDTIM